MALSCDKSSWKVLSHWGSDLFSQSYLSTKTYSSRMMKTNTRQAHIQTSSNVKHHGTEFKCLSQSDGSFALFQLSMFQIYLFQNFSPIPSKHLEAFKIVEGIVGRTKLMNGVSGLNFSFCKSCGDLVVVFTDFNFSFSMFLFRS